MEFYFGNEFQEFSDEYEVNVNYLEDKELSTEEEICENRDSSDI